MLIFLKIKVNENKSRLWTESFNITKKSILPKLICTFNLIPVQIPPVFFVGFHELILKFIWKCKRPRTTKTILGKKKNQIGRLTGQKSRVHGIGRE